MSGLEALSLGLELGGAGLKGVWKTYQKIRDAPEELKNGLELLSQHEDLYQRALALHSQDHDPNYHTDLRLGKLLEVFRDKLAAVQSVLHYDLIKPMVGDTLTVNRTAWARKSSFFGKLMDELAHLQQQVVHRTELANL